MNFHFTNRDNSERKAGLIVDEYHNLQISRKKAKVQEAYGSADSYQILG